MGERERDDRDGRVILYWDGGFKGELNKCRILEVGLRVF